LVLVQLLFSGEPKILWPASYYIFFGLGQLFFSDNFKQNKK